MREETPVGTASHVREVVERYAELDVSAIIFPAPGPWDEEAFRYLDESVIRPASQSHQEYAPGRHRKTVARPDS